MARLSHILLVDDNIHRIYNNTLVLREFADCVISHAKNAEEAIKSVKDIWFDVIFIHCDIENNQGFTAAHDIESLQKKGHIEPVILTGLTLSPEKYEKDARKAGISMLFNDPLTIEQLRKSEEVKAALRSVTSAKVRAVHGRFAAEGHNKYTQKQRSAIKTLNLSQDFTKEHVKDQYRKLVKECHPDIVQTNEATKERFYQINQAYETLLDVFDDQAA